METWGHIDHWRVGRRTNRTMLLEFLLYIGLSGRPRKGINGTKATGKKSSQRSNNWPRLISLVVQALKDPERYLIHEATKAQSHSGGYCNCVLMYVLYHIQTSDS